MSSKAQMRERRRSGAALVETAIILNIVLILFFAVLDYGKLVMTKQLLDNAAREGARQAVVSTNSLTTANITSTVTQFMGGQSLSGMSVQVYQINPTTGA